MTAAPPLAPARRATQAVLVAIAGVGVLSLMDAAVKEVATDVPTWEIVFLRYVFGTLFALPMFLAAHARLPPLEVMRAHLWRSCAVVTTATTFFYALGQLPLAVTLALSFTAPIMIAVMARVGLGERAGAGVFLAIAVGFAGVLTVLGGELQRSGTGTVLGILAATTAAASYAVAMVSLRARATRDPLPVIVFLQNAFAMLLIAPVALAFWIPPSMGQLGWFAMIGLLGTAGHVALAWAYRHAEASRLGAIEYTAFLWAVALGFVFFGEIPSLATLAGAVLIMAGAFLAVHGSRRGA